MNQLSKRFLLLVLSFSCSHIYAQQNISTSSVQFIGIEHRVHAIIGDTFLGNATLDNYAIEQSILSTLGETILGLKAENPISLKAFPNPFTSHLQFQFTQQSNYEIIIINAMGVEIKRVKTQTNISLKLDDLPAGVYVAQVVDLSQNLLNVFEVIKL